MYFQKYSGDYTVLLGVRGATGDICKKWLNVSVLVWNWTQNSDIANGFISQMAGYSTL